MKTLRVWFYDPAADSEGFVNKVVASIDRPFCHVELQFADDRACSIYMGSKVAMRTRTFESPNYVCLKIPCSDQQHTLATGHAEHLHDLGLVFSSLQMTSCLFWTRAMPNPKHTFCSKLVTEILQQAGLVSDKIDAHVTSPSALHRLLQSQEKIAPLLVPRSIQSLILDFKVPRH